MTGSAPAPDNADGRICPHISEDAVRRLAEAVAQLANDQEYFLKALTDFLLAMKPISRERLSANEVRFLIESGDFTAEEWAETSASVDRGSLQLSGAEAFLSHLNATMSIDNVTGFLGWDEEAVQAAVHEGRLYAVEISGRLRFPVWQFSLGSPGKLLRGLAEIIEVVMPRWGWTSVAGFMATPQLSLVAEGPKTPVAWLRDGGDVDAVRQIVESDDWW
jgi:hypothetical protein